MLANISAAISAGAIAFAVATNIDLRWTVRMI